MSAPYGRTVNFGSVTERPELARMSPLLSSVFMDERLSRTYLKIA
jgi:hypothetical protein